MKCSSCLIPLKPSNAWARKWKQWEYLILPQPRKESRVFSRPTTQMSDSTNNYPCLIGLLIRRNLLSTFNRRFPRPAQIIKKIQGLQWQNSKVLNMLISMRHVGGSLQSPVGIRRCPPTTIPVPLHKLQQASEINKCNLPSWKSVHRTTTSKMFYN